MTTTTKNIRLIPGTCIDMALPFGGAAMRTGPVGRMVAAVPIVPGAPATPIAPGAPATPMVPRATPPGTTD